MNAWDRAAFVKCGNAAGGRGLGRKRRDALEINTQLILPHIPHRLILPPALTLGLLGKPMGSLPTRFRKARKEPGRKRPGIVRTSESLREGVRRAAFKPRVGGDRNGAAEVGASEVTRARPTGANILFPLRN